MGSSLVKRYNPMMMRKYVQTFVNVNKSGSLNFFTRMLWKFSKKKNFFEGSLKGRQTSILAQKKVETRRKENTAGNTDERRIRDSREVQQSKNDVY
jgi:hypothetical protein